MIANATPYYLLVDDTTLDIGSTTTPAKNEFAPVTTDPEHIDLFVYVELVHDSDDYLELITNNLHDRTLRLAQVTPNGEVYHDHIGQVWCTEGWTIAGWLPYNRLFGPDGDRIIDIVTRSVRDLDEVHASRRQAYDDAVAAQEAHDPHWSAVLAACRALTVAGLSNIFWFAVGIQFAGLAPLALRARPYIGTTPEWTQGAYDQLVTPHCVAFGETVHPDDVLPAV